MRKQRVEIQIHMFDQAAIRAEEIRQNRRSIGNIETRWAAQVENTGRLGEELNERFAERNAAKASSIQPNTNK